MTDHAQEITDYTTHGRDALSDCLDNAYNRLLVAGEWIKVVPISDAKEMAQSITTARTLVKKVLDGLG